MSGIILSAVGNFNTPTSMTIGTKTITYSVGKIFDYYDSIVTSPGSDVNITVTQDMNCTVQLTSAGGATNNSGAFGGGGQALTFTFTFKAGSTYVLRLGTVATESSSTSGGGYSALFINSVSSSNAIAVVGGGGGCGYGSTAGGAGGIAGSVGPTNVTNGIGFAGATGVGTSPSGGVGGSGTAAGAGGTTAGGTSGSAGSGPLSSTGGAGGTSGVYVGGGGGGGWYGGGGGAANSATPIAGGGGGGGSFLYTSSDDPTKTATYVSSRSGSYVSSGFSSSDSSGRPFMGRAGATGNNVSGTSVYFQWWSSLGTWNRPIPGGTIAAVPASYDCVLAADVHPGSTSIPLVYKLVTTVVANAGATLITVGSDPRRVISMGIDFVVNVASPYTLTATGAGGTTISVDALAATIPVGTTLYIYPQLSTTAATPGAIIPSGASGYSFATASQGFIRIQEPGGGWCYGFSPQGTVFNFSGGWVEPVTMNLGQAIYPSVTLPKGSVVQRLASTTSEFSTSLGVSSVRGAMSGAVRITMN